MKHSEMIVENHIYCDICNKDSADIIGYSTGLKMKKIEKYLKSLGWLIEKDKQICDSCMAKLRKENINWRLRL